MSTDLNFDLHPAQFEVFSDPARFKVVVAGRRFGKPLEVSTPVLTPNGFVPMGDLAVGDKVYHPEGHAVEVISVTDKFIEPSYKFSFDNGEELVSGQNHEWVVEKADKNHSNRKAVDGTVETKDIHSHTVHQKTLKKPSYLSIQNFRGFESEDKDLPIHPYVLGAWLGDGSSVQACIHTEDQQLLDKFDSLGYTTKKYKSPEYRYGVKNLSRHLTQLGMFSNKHVPEQYFLGSREQRLWLLKGLMDTDGTVTPSGKCQFSNTNEKLINAVIRLCVGLGIKCPVKAHRFERTRTRLSQSVGTFGEEYQHSSVEYTLTFTPTINVFDLDRKSKKIKDKIQWNRHFIRDSKFVGCRQVKCIQVGSPDGLFVAGYSCIPTHNSWLAASLCLIHGLQSKNKYGFDTSSADTYVFYIAPTFEQAKKAVWAKLKELGHSVIKNINKNEGTFELVNGRQIVLRGADRPDTIRGAKMSFVVLDEYATMKPEVFDEVIVPALADVVGESLIIGTPDGKNHFYDIHTQAKKIREVDDENGVKEPEWGAFTYRSVDNPTIPIKRELESAAKRGMSEEAIRQEYMASFHASGGKVFDFNQITFTDEEPPSGNWYIAVDPAGYESVDKAKSKSTRLDETAIACVKVGEYGWYVGEIKHGRWDIRRTSIEILKAVQDYQAVAVGIEQGSLKNAIMPYLEDQQRRIGVFANIQPVTHGGKRKVDRIVWALQGRMQHGRLMLPVRNEKNEEWQRHFENQLLDFPNPLSHDDLLDALAYIDQLSEVAYHVDDLIEEEWAPVDPVSGF